MSGQHNFKAYCDVNSIELPTYNGHKGHNGNGNGHVRNDRQHNIASLETRWKGNLR